MTASELRIGNIIHHPHIGGSGYTYVNHRIINDIASHNNPLGYKLILLNEEWLVKLGFSCDKQDGYYDLQIGPENILSIEFPPSQITGWEFQIGYGTNWSKPFSIKYVHQLQNLYFALTGTELTISK